MDPQRGTAHMPCMCDVNPRGSRYACQAPPDARPPLQSQTLCALMPPLIRKRGRASAIYLVSGGTSWNDRLIFFGWDA